MERQSRLSTLASSVGRQFVAVVSSWVIQLTLIQLGDRMLGGWPASAIGELLGCVFGMAIALRLRAPVAAYFSAAMVAFSVSELGIHFYYGIRTAQGAPTHFAVMGASIVGVVLGALMTRGRRPSVSGTVAVRDAPSTGTAMPADNADGANSKRRSDLALQPAGS
jgi:hypothetical protein